MRHIKSVHSCRLQLLCNRVSNVSLSLLSTLNCKCSEALKGIAQYSSLSSSEKIQKNISGYSDDELKEILKEINNSSALQSYGFRADTARRINAIKPLSDIYQVSLIIFLLI